MRSDHDGNTVARGFQEFVPTTGDEAAADKGDIGKLIETGEFPNAVEKKNAATQGFAIPLRAPPGRQPGKQRGDSVEALRMTRSENEDSVGPAGEDRSEERRVGKEC